MLARTEVLQASSLAETIARIDSISPAQEGQHRSACTVRREQNDGVHPGDKGVYLSNSAVKSIRKTPFCSTGEKICPSRQSSRRPSVQSTRSESEHQDVAADLPDATGQIDGALPEAEISR